MKEMSPLIEDMLDHILDEDARDMFESAWQSEVLHKHGRKATKTNFCTLP